MLKKKLPLIIVGLIVIIAIRYNNGLIGKNLTEEKNEITILQLKSFIPASAAFEDEIYEDQWSEIYNSRGSVLGYYTSSAGFTDHISGYSGPVPVLIVVDSEENILGVELLSNRETPRYISVISRTGFFSSWNGLSAELPMDHNIDAVAGATLTTEAVIKGIQLRLSEIYDLPTAGNEVYKDSLRSTLIDISGYLFISFALLSYFIKKVRRYRLILLLSSISIMGILKGELLSIFFFYNLFSGGWPGGLISSIGILAVLSIILPLVTNRSFYCQFVCPFGAAQELLSKAGKHVQLSIELRSRLKSFKYIWFGVIAVAIVIDFSIDLSLIEPFSIFNYQTAHMITIILSLLTAAASLFISKPWCNFVCPTGTLFDLLKDRK